MSSARRWVSAIVLEKIVVGRGSLFSKSKSVQQLATAKPGERGRF
jgi:hypothetical protein